MKAIATAVLGNPVVVFLNPDDDAFEDSVEIYGNGKDESFV